MQLLSNPTVGFDAVKQQQDTSKDMSLGIPPMITHTAATPQGSPNATLEPSRSFQTSPLSLHIQAASLCSLDQSIVSQTSSIKI